MAAQPRLTREDLFLRKKIFFRRNAFLIIDKMVELSYPFSEQKSLLVDEVLHSIFFLGGINFPKFLPEHIIPKDTKDGKVLLEALMRHYPGPFNCYTSQLPKRSPTSCVLDMIVHLTGEENENEITERLKEFMDQLKEGRTTELVSSTICVSQPDNSQTSKRYYGVSMSTSGHISGQIVIAASCLSNLDSYVAGAVMTYILKNRQREYFDGRIFPVCRDFPPVFPRKVFPRRVFPHRVFPPERLCILPMSVRCQAFSLSDGEPMAPCRSCGNLFGLETSSEKEWPYGNCAEVESVNNLLKNERGVKWYVQATCTNAEWITAIATERVRRVLEGLVRMVNFEWREEEFYTPQATVF